MKKTKLSSLTKNKSFYSTTIEPEGEDLYRVTNFYIDKNSIKRRSSYLTDEIIEDIEMKESKNIHSSVKDATAFLYSKLENGYYINFYKR